MEELFRDVLARLDRLSGLAPELTEGVRDAIAIADRTPDMSLTLARKVLESVVRDIYERQLGKPAGTQPLENLIQHVAKEGHLPRRLMPHANAVRDFGNLGTHGFDDRERVTTSQVRMSLTHLLDIIEWHCGREAAPEAPGGGEAPKVEGAGLKVVVLYKRNAHPDEELLQLLEKHLTGAGHRVFTDRHLRTGMEWASEIQREVRSADAVIALLSVASIGSEMLEEEIHVAHEAAQTRGKPSILPVRISYDGPLPEPLAGILDPIQYALWRTRADDQTLVTNLMTALRNPPTPRRVRMDDGALPPDDELYIMRATDEQFAQALGRRDSIVRIKGARQMGKTSLLARSPQLTRRAGARVVITDFQKFNADDLRSLETFFRVLAELLADKLGLDGVVERSWSPARGPNANLERFVRNEVLAKNETPLIWGMDEVDRLFTCSFGSDVFGLFRSWHNDRAFEPDGAWSRLTLVICYATEAHLFITDLNQSPFNVGTVLELQDFSIEQVAELNQRSGAPLSSAEELARFYALLGGSPYFVRRGLRELAKSGGAFGALEAVADRDEGPFGDHLRRLLVLLARDEALGEVVREVLQGRTSVPDEAFYRLRSAGIMTGPSSKAARLRCGVYVSFLRRHLLA